MGRRTLLEDTRGSATVELFLVIPMLILVVVAALQVIGVAMSRVDLQGAAREGARVAATSPDPAKAVDASLAALPPSMRSQVRVSVSRPARVGAPARVTLSFRKTLSAPFPSSWGVNLTATATMRTEL